MSRSASALLAAATVAITFAAPAGAAPPADACSLLKAAEVGKAVGAT